MSALEYFPEKYLQRPWGRLAYRQSGGGSPIILLHGEGRDQSDWSEIIPYIKNHRLIIPDLQGHGKSSVPHEAPALNRMVDDIVDLATDLWLGKVDVIGHSLGGIIAQQMLRRFPESINKLVLLEGWVNLKYSHVLSDSMTVGLSETDAAEISRQVHNTFVRWMPAFRDEFWATVERCDTEQLLRQTSHKVLHIYGDRNKSETNTETVGMHMSENVSVQWIKGAGHFMHLSHTKEVGEIIQNYICPEIETERKLPSADLTGLYDYRNGQR